MSNLPTVKMADGVIYVNVPSTQHAYDIVTKVDGEEVHIVVDANTRTSAAKRVRDMGYEVCSVNMVG